MFTLANMVVFFFERESEREVMRRVVTVPKRLSSLSRRGYLQTSMFKENQFPYQFVVPKSLAAKNYGVLLRSRSKIASESRAQPDLSQEQTQTQAVSESQDVMWEDESGRPVTGADVLVQADAQRSPSIPHQSAKTRLPLDLAARIELHGDYLTEAQDGHTALQFFGVAMTVYEAHYRSNHSHLSKMRIKLARAFRMAGQADSAISNANIALDILDNNEKPHVENICEALLELGMAYEAKNEPSKAAVAYEDAVTVANAAHDFGASHRGLRGLPIASRRFFLNIVHKIRYFSPYEYDRVFHIVDTCLSEAERCYRLCDNRQGVIRVLEQRKIITDRKYFNMRDYAYKIRTMRGHNHKKSYSVTSRPSADEIIGFTPTVHQVHFDYTKLDTAPLGKEHLVQVGANAKYLDEGDPLRFYTAAEQLKAARISASQAFVQQQWDSSAKNT